MTQRVYLRVVMGGDGKTPNRELIVDGKHVADITVFDTIEALTQFASSIRWEPELQAKMKGNRAG